MIKKIINTIKIIKTFRFDDISRNLTKCDVLFFCSDGDRGINLNNLPYSPLIDSIKDSFESKNFKCVTIAHPQSKLVGLKAYGNPISINRSYNIALLKNFFNKLILKKRVNFFLLHFYKKIFNKVNPKICITIGISNELCLAARELNIFHYELLHGIGFDPIPWDWEKKALQNLPQGILTLDAVSTKTFSFFEKQGIIVQQIAHPFISRFSPNMIHNLPDEWKLSPQSKGYKKEILVGLQWGYDGEYECFKGILKNGLMYDELIEVVKQTKDTIFWRFRFHPVQMHDKTRYKKHFEIIKQLVENNANCEWIESSTLPLPVLSTVIDGHITMCSMTAYDVSYFGISTLALCPSLRDKGIYVDMFKDLEDRDYLIKANPFVSSILNWAHNVEKREPYLQDSNSPSVIEYLTNEHFK